MYPSFSSFLFQLVLWFFFQHMYKSVEQTWNIAGKDLEKGAVIIIIIVVFVIYKKKTLATEVSFLNFSSNIHYGGKIISKELHHAWVKILPSSSGNEFYDNTKIENSKNHCILFTPFRQR